MLREVLKIFPINFGFLLYVGGREPCQGENRQNDEEERAVGTAEGPVRAAGNHSATDSNICNKNISCTKQGRS